MNSETTMMLFEFVNEPKTESRKPAKVSPAKCDRFRAKNAETAERLRNVGNRNKEFLDKFRMKVIKNGGMTVRLNSGRKIKLKPVVKEGETPRLYKIQREVVQEGEAIEIPVSTIEPSLVNNEPVQQYRSNVLEFPDRVSQTPPEVTQGEGVTQEVPNNISGFPTQATTRSDLYGTNNLDNSTAVLSRSARMDYTTHGVISQPQEEVRVSPQKEVYSATDYVRQKTASSTAGNVGDFAIGSTEKQKTTTSNNGSNANNNVVDFVSAVKERMKKYETLVSDTNRLDADTQAQMDRFQKMIEYLDGKVLEAQEQFDAAKRENEAVIEATMALGDDFPEQVAAYGRKAG